MAMMVFWGLVGVVALLLVLGALGIYGMYLAYTSGEEWQVRQLERKHGLRDD